MSSSADTSSDSAFVQRVVQALSPNRLLKWYACEITRGVKPSDYPGGQLWTTFDIAWTKGIGATAGDLEGMEAEGAARRALLERSSAFRQSRKRIEEIGVTAKWGADGSNSFTSRCLRIVVPHKALTPLQEMAADDAGIIEAGARSAAAALFDRWLLQNYHPDWRDYRQAWPLVEGCPYDARRTAPTMAP
jgi:hypothetical protein